MVDDFIGSRHFFPSQKKYLAALPPSVDKRSVNREPLMFKVKCDLLVLKQVKMSELVKFRMFG